MFEPLRLGALSLSNRVVMAPFGRVRAVDHHVPGEAMRSYYCQRASAGLIIAQAAAVSPQGVSWVDSPGIWCSDQVRGWRQVTDAVHKKGGKIMLQLGHAGRVSDPEFLLGQIPVAPSAIACPGSLNISGEPRNYVVPRALHADEIKGVVEDFAEAAARAREAGFDGITIQAGEGSLIDQFLNDHSNLRDDEHGGSVTNRTRLLLDIVDACIGIWGADRVGVLLSPLYNQFGMHDSDPATLFAEVTEHLDQLGIAFVFVRQIPGAEVFTNLIRDRFGGALVLNPGQDPASASSVLADGIADAVAFGQAFVANPDLIERVQNRIPLND